MFITKKNYNKQLKELSEKNLKLSEEFLDLKEKLNIKDLNIASVGNSISAGYSKCDKILPFLMRTSIYDLADDINYFSYARVRRNEEKNILRWYSSNISHSDINNLNIDDIKEKKFAYVEKHWNGTTLKNFKDLSNKNNIGFKDFNLLDNSIIIYNGFTGEFTNAKRKGTEFTDKFRIMHAFKKDLLNARLVLTQIYLDNPNTQVYVCGLPNFMGTGIISVLNGYIKKLCNQIPNTVFLPGTVRNCLFFLEGQKEFDVHYSQPEYTKLWNNITQTMMDNYVSIKFNTSLIERLKNYSLEVEKESTVSKGNIEDISKIIEEEFEKYTPLFLKNNQNIDNHLDGFINYYNENYLSTFPCTPKEEVVQKVLFKKM